MSVFRELLVIKSFRENRAELSLARQRQALLKAQSDEEAARTVLSEFEDFSTRREATLYRDLCSRIVGLRDIEEVQNIIADLRKQKEERELELATAGKRREEEAGLLTEAQVVYQAATRQKQKFVELAQSQADETAREAERKEELEMEEASSFGRPKVDPGNVEMESTA